MTDETKRACDGPLEGLRVLDLSAVVLGPMATKVLADFGADVVKIEPPGGDGMRFTGVTPHPGLSSIFVALNRNKRSLVLDLKQPDDAQVLRQLIRGADVLVHNMRVAAIERLGFGYAAVEAINPRIVYCAATGFGQDGPHRAKPAFDDVIQAACGFVDVSSIERDEPDYVATLVADKTTGLAVANAVMAGLLHRERRGEGQYIEVPMMETMTSFVLAEHMGGMAFPGGGKAGYPRLLEGGRKPARTLDGWIAMLPYTERNWKAFFAAVGRADIGEALQISSREERNANIHTLYRHLREIVRTRDTAYWLALCDRLDIPATPIYAIDDLPRHPHLEAVGLFQATEHPTAGPLREMRPAARFSRTPLSLRRHAPTLGEHTAELLAEADAAGRKAPD